MDIFDKMEPLMLGGSMVLVEHKGKQGTLQMNWIVFILNCNVVDKSYL